MQALAALAQKREAPGITGFPDVSAVWPCGAGLYAPQDAEELAGAGEAVATGVELLLEELPAAGPAHAQADAAARRAADAHGALAGCLRALADDSPECSSQRPEE